jgi:hypothetical protein
MSRKEPYQLREMRETRFASALESGCLMLRLSDDSVDAGYCPEPVAPEEEAIHERVQVKYEPPPRRKPVRGGLDFQRETGRA